MRWIIRNELSGRVRPAWFHLAGIAVRPALDSLQEEILLRCGELQAHYPDPASALPLFTPARRMYHALDLDPSRHRPSSEALVRRVLQGKGLYRVNTAVDAANLASMTSARPVGLYDADRIQPFPPGESADGAIDATAVIVLRMGRPGEEYSGIGKEVIRLEGRPGLFDQVGPFGNPSSDSDRTKVTECTTQLLFVLFEPADEPADSIDRHLGLSRAIMLRAVGGRVEE